MNIHLGYEVGTGKAVAIPLKHTVITGQTQEAGKTTALEGLITRSKLKALTFITKRGEGAFANGRRINPYFREQADWKYVAAILEASRGEKLKFERSWIIRASKGAHTLADVQRNVQKSLETAKGLSADVYLTLEAYLEDVVPQISKVKWADRVDLQPGVNVMDLRDISQDMQHLVIRSSLEWVLNKEDHTVVVIPEAWKFIPESRGTPVKLAAESFIRQSAGLFNFLWLDSQDIAGIDKIILKSVPMWILGKQREFNEIKRTIANIPPGIKRPKPDQIATLSIGEFYSCWDKEIFYTYAQPAWMSDFDAYGVATGAMPKPVAPSVTPNLQPEPPIQEANITPPVEEVKKEDDAMNEKQFKEFNDSLKRIDGALERLANTLGQRLDIATLPAVLEERQASGPVNVDEDALYQRLLARLKREAPAILKTIAYAPELHVTVERPVIEMNNKTPIGKIAAMLASGWFEKQTTVSEVLEELVSRGVTTARPQVANMLNELTEQGILLKASRADGTKVYTRAPELEIIKREK